MVFIVDGVIYRQDACSVLDGAGRPGSSRLAGGGAKNGWGVV